jgi:hypothetical protein
VNNLWISFLVIHLIFTHLFKKIPAMRRLLRSLKTGEYFRDGRWTPDSAQAQHFSDSGEVIETCLRYHLTEVELVLQLDSEAVGVSDTHVRLFDYACAEW